MASERGEMSYCMNQRRFSGKGDASAESPKRDCWQEYFSDIGDNI